MSREAFEAVIAATKKLALEVFKDDCSHTKQAIEFFAAEAGVQWQAATAAAIPAGYVLVKESEAQDAKRYDVLTESMRRRIWIWNHVLTEDERNRGHTIEEVLDAMLQAAKEQT